MYIRLYKIDDLKHSGMEHIEVLMLLNHLLPSLCKKILVFGGHCLSFSSKHTLSSGGLPINCVNPVHFQERVSSVGFFKHS